MKTRIDGSSTGKSGGWGIGEWASEVLRDRKWDEERTGEAGEVEGGVETRRYQT